MKKLDERKKGFEGKFARDQELEFKILARRNKYLGVWAAEKLGLSGSAVADYFAGVVKSDLEEDDNHSEIIDIFTHQFIWKNQNINLVLVKVN